jgi:hypothetical protein
MGDFQRPAGRGAERARRTLVCTRECVSVHAQNESRIGMAEAVGYDARAGPAARRSSSWRCANHALVAAGAISLDS